MADPPTEQADRQQTLHAVPTAGPKRKEAARPLGACAARVKIHGSPQSLPDLRTTGYTLPTRVRGHLPTDLLGRKQLLLAGSQQECRVVDCRSGPDFVVTRSALRRPLNLIQSHFSCIRFPPNGFAVFLTLFSKYFSPFPHGTCSLSVSCRYLALDGVYHPLWAAFPNNPTLRRRSGPSRRCRARGSHPLRRAFPGQLRQRQSGPCRLSRPQFSGSTCQGFQARAVPTSLAVTGGILVSFFSSAY